MSDLSATYSPDDNKLRLYSVTRLPRDLYERVRAAGFSWAPRQELFVAPAWSPEREDLLLELCGDIGDEDTSLVDRAEARADRFDDYSEKRKREADAAHEVVDQVAKRFEGGQPILVGHHSERKARKDAERIENGMRRALRLFETSSYWTRRAAGALAHAKYVEQPAVRARRIKRLEAEQRKAVKNKARAEQELAAWSKPDLTRERALLLANVTHGPSRCYPLADFPRDPPASQYEGSTGIWSAITDGIISHTQAAAIVVAAYQGRPEQLQRWIDHYDNRLAYEKAMLDAAGKSQLLERQKPPAQAPLLNYRIADGETLKTENEYHRGQVMGYAQVGITKAELARIPTDYKGTRLSLDRSHRFRIASLRGGWAAVFLTDSKEHERPQEGEPVARAPRPVPEYRAPRPPTEAQSKAAELRGALKAGVQAVSAPSLFETPAPVLREMLDAADVSAGQRVLEPSAGTGCIARAVVERCGAVVCVELDARLCDGLRRLPGAVVVRADFAEHSDADGFDRVVMNPPFEHGQDREHVMRAYSMLRPGGRLVAVMSEGPFFRSSRADQEFRAWLDERGGESRKLPDGAFKESGTGVQTRLVIIDRKGPENAANAAAS